jgi:hypothetical protein
MLEMVQAMNLQFQGYSLVPSYIKTWNVLNCAFLQIHLPDFKHLHGLSATQEYQR